MACSIWAWACAWACAICAWPCFIAASICSAVTWEYSFFFLSIVVMLPVEKSTIVSLSAVELRILVAVK